MNESPPLLSAVSCAPDQSAFPPTISNQHGVHPCGWQCKVRNTVVSTSSETRNWGAQCGRWQRGPSWRTEVVARGFESCSVRGTGDSYDETSGYTCVKHRWRVISVLKIILYVLVLQVFHLQIILENCKKYPHFKCPSKVYQTDVQDL
jgi:hypothetical protein